jgi:hypothetical protein
MCKSHGVTNNVNHFDFQRPEFHLSLKIQYQSTIWHRIIEVMAITHFWAGAHLCFVNEFPSTRYWAWTQWYKSQDKNNRALMERDPVVKKEVEKSLAQQKKRDHDRNKRSKYY